MSPNQKSIWKTNNMWQYGRHLIGTHKLQLLWDSQLVLDKTSTSEILDYWWTEQVKRYNYEPPQGLNQQFKRSERLSHQELNLNTWCKPTATVINSGKILSHVMVLCIWITNPESVTNVTMNVNFSQSVFFKFYYKLS